MAQPNAALNAAFGVAFGMVTSDESFIAGMRRAIKIVDEERTNAPLPPYDNGTAAYGWQRACARLEMRFVAEAAALETGIAPGGMPFGGQSR